MEYLCHKWSRICSTCRMRFQVLCSFMTYHYELVTRLQGCMGVATLGSSRHGPLHTFDIFLINQCSTFLTGIRMYISLMILWKRLSVGTSGGLLQMMIQRDYSTFYMQQTATYTRHTQNHQYLTDNSSVITNEQESVQCNETHAILLKVDYGRWTTIQLMTSPYTQICASRLGYDYW